MSTPYLLVEEKDHQQSGHVGNPMLMPSTSTSATLASPVAAAVDGSELSSKVGCIVKGMMGHGILAVLSFLSFALIGSIPNINVQSGQVSAEDLLLTNNCTEESGISGKLDFAAFRLLLVVGVLCWLYSCGSFLLGLFKVAVSACLATKQPRLLVLTEKFSLIVAVCDGLFTVLTFLVSRFVLVQPSRPKALSWAAAAPYPGRFSRAWVRFLELIYLRYPPHPVGVRHRSGTHECATTADVQGNGDLFHV